MQFPPGTDDFSSEKAARMATGMAADAAGHIFISDNGVDQNVKVFSPEGKLLREIGRKGGRAAMGPWDVGGMFQPHGIAIDSSGQLWVTETDNQPRRISVWDSATGASAKSSSARRSYSAPGGGFDPEDASRWIGGGVQWKLDLAKGSAVPVSTLYHPLKAGEMQEELPSHAYYFFHKDGRTFLIGQGGYQSVYELRADGSLKLWAACGTVHTLAGFPRWTLPTGFTQAPKLKEVFANAKTDVTAQFRDHLSIPEPALQHLGSALWVDRNGDDVVQPDEVEVTDEPWRLISSGWGPANPTLDLKFASTFDKKAMRVELKLRGFLPSGAPDYNLAKALAAARPLQPPGSDGRVIVGEGGDSIVDGFGRMLVNSSPLLAYDESGKLLWTYPQSMGRRSRLARGAAAGDGRHAGRLWFLARAPLDETSRGHDHQRQPRPLLRHDHRRALPRRDVQGCARHPAVGRLHDRRRMLRRILRGATRSTATITSRAAIPTTASSASTG